jgi:hypothetical protein
MLRRLLRWIVPSRATLRVTTYGAFAFFLAALLAGRVLKADVTEAALAAGHELAQLADLLHGAETITINGERMHHASVHTEQDVATVLDRLEAYCTQSPNFVGRAMRDLSVELAKHGQADPPSHRLKLGILRSQSEVRGMVACFVDDRPSGLREMGARLERFLRTSKISEFGQFRYAYVERTHNGGAHVVTTWADSGLDVGAMFPASGDAAGRDSGLLPRPPDAQRTLEAAAEGHPYSLRVYVSRARADVVRAFYADWMGRNGFAPAGGGQSTGDTSVFQREDGYQVFITLAESEGKTSVTLTEAGSRIMAVDATVE